MTLTTVATKTTNVVTLIPPPVPAGAAPMNIKITVRSFCDIVLTGDIYRGETRCTCAGRWKKETNNFWKKFSLQCVVPFKSKETNRTDDKQGDRHADGDAGMQV